MRLVVAVAAAAFLAVLGFVFQLQGRIGDVKADHVGIARDHDEFRKSSGLLPGMDARLKKVEGLLELITREKEEPSGSTPISLQTFDGPWKVEFRQGSSGKSIFEVLDSKTFRVTGKEDKDGGLEMKGTGELKGGKLMLRYRATSKKHPKGYNGRTILTPFSSSLLKGYFTNDLGEFDLVTLTRED